MLIQFSFKSRQKMRALLFLTTCASLALADVSHLISGYQYNKPKAPPTSYGVPLHSVPQPSNQLPSNTYGTPNQFGSQTNQFQLSNVYGGPKTSHEKEAGNEAQHIQLPIHEHQQFQQNFQTVGPKPSLDVRGGEYSFNQFNQQQQLQGFPNRNSFESNYQSQYQNPGQVQVTRNLYFFSAPEEPAEVRQNVRIPVPAPRKNINVIFIKAPSPPAPAQLQIPAYPQNEQKTLVYVLVKKPEELGEINFPTPAPAKPTKPEVYFIRYKTQQEAEEAINKVQAGHEGALGVGSLEGSNVLLNSLSKDQVSNRPTFTFTNVDTNTGVGGSDFVNTANRGGYESTGSSGSDVSGSLGSGFSGSLNSGLSGSLGSGLSGSVGSGYSSSSGSTSSGSGYTGPSSGSSGHSSFSFESSSVSPASSFTSAPGGSVGIISGTSTSSGSSGGLFNSGNEGSSSAVSSAGFTEYGPPHQ